jgi:hypothetical protein
MCRMIPRTRLGCNQSEDEWIYIKWEMMEKGIAIARKVGGEDSTRYNGVRSS